MSAQPTPAEVRALTLENVALFGQALDHAAQQGDLVTVLAMMEHADAVYADVAWAAQHEGHDLSAYLASRTGAAPSCRCRCHR